MARSFDAIRAELQAICIVTTWQTAGVVFLQAPEGAWQRVESIVAVDG